MADMAVRSSQIRCQFFTYVGLDFIPESKMFKGEGALTVYNQSRIFQMLHKIRFSTWSPSWRYTVGEQNTLRAEMEILINSTVCLSPLICQQ